MWVVCGGGGTKKEKSWMTMPHADPQNNASILTYAEVQPKPKFGMFCALCISNYHHCLKIIYMHSIASCLRSSKNDITYYIVGRVFCYYWSKPLWIETVFCMCFDNWKNAGSTKLCVVIFEFCRQLASGLKNKKLNKKKKQNKTTKKHAVDLSLS